MGPQAANVAARVGLTAAVAAAVVAVAYHSGSYGESSRDTIAIVAWWLVAAGVAVGLLPLGRLTAPLVSAVVLLGAFAVWSLVSASWAASGNDAFIEFTRVMLYVAILLLVGLASSRATASAWCDGLALGVVAVAVVALHSRLFSGGRAESAVGALLPSASTRLTHPLGYWNGLGIFAALAVPLLLRVAVGTYPAIVRALAAAPLPAIAAVVYLTSSRGAVATAAVGTLAFVLLARRRADAVVAVVLAGAASAVAVDLLRRRHVLVNGPLASHAARAEGRSFAWLLIGICAVLVAAYALCSWLLRRFPAPRAVELALAPAVVVVTVVAIAAAHPVRRFDAFKQLPAAAKKDDPIEAHLLAGSGSGRWQAWTAAVDQWRRHRLKGGAAGSYEAWWAQHGTTPAFIKNAHNLYAEVLGELGVIGLALLVAALACGVVAGLARSLRWDDADSVAPACLAAFLAYAVAAGVDWMWELTAVTAVGVALLALLTGDATVRRRAGAPALSRPRWRPWRVVALVAGAALVAVHAVPLLAGVRLQDSEAKAARGDLSAATTAAAAARDVTPWAPGPYLQMALIAERADQLGLARRWVDAAIQRDSTDWRLWLIRSRLETKAGAIAEAKASLRRAAALNPRSPLFAGVR